MQIKIKTCKTFLRTNCFLSLDMSCGPRMTFQGLDFKIGASTDKLEESFDFRGHSWQVWQNIFPSVIYIQENVAFHSG